MTDRGDEDRNLQPKAMKKVAKLMNKDQWRQIEKIFYSAMELPLDERDDFVGQACAMVSVPRRRFALRRWKCGKTSGWKRHITGRRSRIRASGDELRV